MNEAINVSFCEDVDDAKLGFAVIAARYKGKWVFVRHRERSTFEIPGGHIEPTETPDEAARRELFEETGATEFTLFPVCVYSVTCGESASYGKLFFAQVETFSELPPDFKMAERIFSADMPERLTYPQIQPHLFEKVQAWLDEHTTHFYFIRHAMSDTSIRDAMTRPLTETGHDKARELVSELSSVQFDTIYSSPFLRALQTVQPLADAKALQVEPVQDFRERKSDSDWNRETEYWSLMERQWGDFSYTKSNGESLREVQDRNIAALNKLLDINEGKNIAVGTHGTALSTILNYYNPEFGYGAFKRILPIMPYVVRLDFIGRSCVDISELTDVK